METTKRLIKIQPVIQQKLVTKIGKAKSQESLPSVSSHRIPPGFFTVYVGLERERFLIPTGFLNFPIFVYLLDKAGEEYGFKCNGGIVLPSEIDFFKKVLKILEKDEKKYGNLEVNEFLKVISKVGFENSSSSKQGNYSSHAIMPSVQKLWVSPVWW